MVVTLSAVQIMTSKLRFLNEQWFGQEEASHPAFSEAEKNRETEILRESV
jgi:hypothetical protein